MRLPGRPDRAQPIPLTPNLNPSALADRRADNDA